MKQSTSSSSSSQTSTSIVFFFSPSRLLPSPYLRALCLVLLFGAAAIEFLVVVVIMPSSMRRFSSANNNIFGFAQPQFARVEKVFRRNFLDGWEREGAAIAIYHRGELVVDLQGGYADASAGREWTADTRTVVFSATKAIGALVIGMLVDRGHLRYDDLVCKFWPEFARHGKENITVDWIMSHRAGLAAIDMPISKRDAFDEARIAECFENQKPHWIPGTRSGYHALTYGWLVDQIVRRVDPKHRSVGAFFREEIAVPNDIDFHIGLPPAEEHTMSRLSTAPTLHLFREILYDPRILIMLGILNLRPPGALTWKMKANPTWARIEKNLITFNDPELHRMEQVAALGIGKARDLGKIFALMLQGKFVSGQLLEKYRNPQIASGLDEVVMAPMAKGHGFYYEAHPKDSGRWLVGHPGYGGSSVMMDMEREIVIAYVTNGLKTGMGELARTYRHLRNAVFECIV